MSGVVRPVVGLNIPVPGLDCKGPTLAREPTTKWPVVRSDI